MGVERAMHKRAANVRVSIHNVQAVKGFKSRR